MTSRRLIESLNKRPATAGGLSVVSPFDVDVTTNKTVYRRGQTSTITAIVTAAGAPVANATVALTIIMPDGSQTAVDVVTKRNGEATSKLRTNKGNPKGEWEIRARTTMGGLTVSAAAIFRVD
jgi:uncharacterized protein YfaS (alpha-2-macroglobulin family)